MDNKVKMFITLIDGYMPAGCEYFNYSGNTKTICYTNCKISPNDYKCICNCDYVDEEEFNKSINKIIKYLADNEIKEILVDLDEREKQLSPGKEMTIEEIEKELGYKVKIISKYRKKGKKNG